MKLSVLVLGLLFALAGCGDLGTSVEGGCKKSSDCPPEHMCVVEVGVCSGFTTPLDAPPDGGP